jgi:hypothetical protein
MAEEEEKRVLVPRQSPIQWIMAVVLILASAALLYYAWWGYQQL